MPLEDAPILFNGILPTGLGFGGFDFFLGFTDLGLPETLLGFFLRLALSLTRDRLPFAALGFFFRFFPFFLDFGPPD